MSYNTYGWRNLNQKTPDGWFKNWPFFSRFFKTKASRLRLRRDYQPKTFINPFYSQLIRPPRRTKAKKIKLIILFLALLINLTILLRHPFFNINQINLSGQVRIAPSSIQTIIDQELNRRKLFFFSQGNYWLANSSRIARAITASYSLENLKVNKKFPRSLTINLTEKEAALVYQVGLKKWLLDNQGKIIQEAGAGDETNRLPIVVAESVSSTMKLATTIVPPATIKFLTFLQAKIPEMTKVEVAFGKLKDEEGRVLHLTTSENWQIYLDRQNDWDKQVNVLATILNTKLKGGREKLKYIDVRYENRAYFQ